MSPRRRPRLAILSRSRKLHSIGRLRFEAMRAGIECDIIDPLACQIVVDNKRHGIYVDGQPLPHYDAVLPRIGASITHYGVAVVHQFESLGTRVINGSQAIAESRDKLRALQILSRAGLKIPTTVLARNGKALKTTVETVGGLPAVLKLLQGTQGVGVMIADSQQALSSVLDSLWSLDQEVFIQQFLKKGAGRDYRAFVVGNKVIASMVRKAPPGEFRSNIHRGGIGQAIKLPKSYEKAAIAAAKAVGLSIAGVDLMEGESGPVILEINSSPGFEGIEKATRVNIASAIIHHILAQTRRKGKR